MLRHAPSRRIWIRKSLFDTQITVFTGICNRLVCVPDAIFDETCNGFTLNTIGVEWASLPGISYYIRVDGIGDGAIGSFGLSMQPAPTPALPSKRRLRRGSDDA